MELAIISRLSRSQEGLDVGVQRHGDGEVEDAKATPGRETQIELTYWSACSLGVSTATIILSSFNLR